jgi:transposase
MKQTNCNMESLEILTAVHGVGETFAAVILAELGDVSR